MLRTLYTTPPGEFVAARTALAKERRQAGDRAGATALAALRKPSAVDWALNVVAADHPEVIDDFLAAAARVREAQTAAAEGRGGADGRDALRELRTQAARVVALVDEAAGRSASGGLTAAATARLAGLVADVGGGDQLRAAQLGSSPSDVLDPFAALELSTAAPTAQAAAAAAAAPATKPTKAAKAAKAAARPSAKEQARRRRLEEAVATAERAYATARQRVDDLDEQLEVARNAVTAAEEQLQARQSALAEAASARDAAAEQAARAEAALADARATLGP